jgi:hypothetical protein
MKLLSALREAIDPHGPLGEILSPSDVFKQRGALKTGAAIVMRAQQGVVEQHRHGVEATLAAPRFVTFGTEDAPKNRIRVLSPSVEEHWEAVPEKIPFGDPIPMTVPIAGFRVTQHVREQHCTCDGAKFEQRSDGLIHVRCGRPAKSRVQGEIAEHIMALQIAPEEDALYCGYYPGIKGNDPLHHDPTKTGMAAWQGGDIVRAKYEPARGDGVWRATNDGTPIRGGTEIRGGRREYREKTKGYYHWDSGTQAHLDRIDAGKKAERAKQFEVNQEKAHAQLPRKLGEL